MIYNIQSAILTLPISLSLSLSLSLSFINTHIHIYDPTYHTQKDELLAEELAEKEKNAFEKRQIASRAAESKLVASDFEVGTYVYYVVSLSLWCFFSS